MAFVTVEGKVEKAFNGGLGFAVVERWQVNGEDRKRRWAVWFDAAPTIGEGQSVKVSGTFSSKIREYDVDGQTRRTVDHNLNHAKALEAPEQPSSSAPDAYQAAGVDTWAGDDSAPF